MFYNIIIFLITIFMFSNASASDSEIYYNYGLREGKDKTKIYLTIDMCPSSKKGYNKDIFLSLQELSKQQKKAIPIAIAISGKWIHNHEKSLQEIKDLETQGYISITWINHSYQHYYNKDAKIKDNFMLYDTDNAIDDIHENEKIMREHGLKVSKFFRFPGLISNDYLNETVKNLGYTILGANTWLAKTNRNFHGGNIILIHGNLNEQRGVDLFLLNVQQNKFANFTFAPLSDLCNEGLCTTK